ncbi:MAG: IS1595 family transposase [Chloroflexi bacterium]|nr:MAG: IS1595 family transposase [Chloroflexota bacterium]
MVRTTYRIVYLIVLTVVLVHLLIYPIGCGVGFREERLSMALLTALHVREVVVTSRALWKTGRRQWQLWRKRRQARRTKSKVKLKKDLVNLAAQMFPDPEAWSWAEEIALAGIKVGLRGLFSLMSESACADLFLRMRWVLGVKCPLCGCEDVKCKDPHYRPPYRRWKCPDCSLKQGREVTFTDLHGSFMEGSHLECRLWLWAMMLYVSGDSAENIAKELRVNRKTAQRMVRLFQLTYFSMRFRVMLKGQVEFDEAYVIAGLKGHAGGLSLERPARKRGLKKPGRGTWDSDKVPVLGLVDRQGNVYLIPMANVRSETIRPFIERLVARGTQVYTDEYNIYLFLRRLGYQHETVNHSRKEYARGEVHVNTVEGLWNLLRKHLYVHHGVSKVYLPLYVARFEFIHNRRSQTSWSKMVDLLQLDVHADGRQLRKAVREGQVKGLCPIPGLEAA